jgi:heme-degrading monooxygenase HmoA
MITRTWHGIVPIRLKKEFETYLQNTGVSDTTGIKGNRGAYVKIAEQGEYAHFFLCTVWDSMESIRTYAGSNPETAVTYPEDDTYGLISDPIVIHQEVTNSGNPFSI